MQFYRWISTWKFMACSCVDFFVNFRRTFDVGG